jgi:2-C-methyl-D-erythritol 4-phosphate cytidylyltransferase
MNIALIIAGGTGKRTQQEISKQFINVYDKPILDLFNNRKNDI